MAKILLIDDDLSTVTLIKRVLGQHDLLIATNGTDAKQILDLSPDVDLLLLDLNLPDTDGMVLLQELRSLLPFRFLPTILLSGRNTSSDKVAGLNLGADDYVTKPFDPLELGARVSVQLRRHLQSNGGPPLLVCNRLSLDVLAQRAFCTATEPPAQLEITALEFRILLFFVKHKGQVLSRQQLLTNVWSDETHVVDRTIDSHISKLRPKIRNCGLEIESVYGEGYRLDQRPIAA